MNDGTVGDIKPGISGDVNLVRHPSHHSLRFGKNGIFWYSSRVYGGTRSRMAAKIGARLQTLFVWGTSAYLLALLAPLPSVYGGTQAKQGWRDYSAEGFYLRSIKDPGASLMYREALNSAQNERAPKDVILDLKLNEVQNLIEAGDLQQAQSILSSCYGPIAKKYNDSLLMLRYWRRCRALARARQNYNDALTVQRKIVELVGKHFDSTSSAYVSELKEMRSILGTLDRWCDAYEIDKTYCKIAQTDAFPAIRERVRSLHNDFRSWFKKAAVSKPLIVGQRELLMIVELFPDPHEQLSIWKKQIEYGSIAPRIRPDVNVLIKELVEKLGANASIQEKTMEKAALTGELFKKAP